MSHGRMVVAVPPLVPMYPVVGVAAGQAVVEPPLPVEPPVPVVAPPSVEPPVPVALPEVSVQPTPQRPRIAASAILFQRSMVFIEGLFPVARGLNVRHHRSVGRVRRFAVGDGALEEGAERVVAVVAADPEEDPTRVVPGL